MGHYPGSWDGDISLGAVLYEGVVKGSALCTQGGWGGGGGHTHAGLNGRT